MILQWITLNGETNMKKVTEAMLHPEQFKEIWSM